MLSLAFLILTIGGLFLSEKLNVQHQFFNSLLKILGSFFMIIVTAIFIHNYGGLLFFFSFPK